VEERGANARGGRSAREGSESGSHRAGRILTLDSPCTRRSAGSYQPIAAERWRGHGAC
jgi:hypothetical protein